ncbi:unnamed protein product [Closterium sp. NIES-54]
MASAGDSCDSCGNKPFSHATTSAASNAADSAAKIPSHVPQLDKSDFANTAKPAVSNPTGATEHGDGNATKVPEKRLVRRLESSDPLALLKAVMPMQVVRNAVPLKLCLCPIAGFPKVPHAHDTPSPPPLAPRPHCSRCSHPLPLFVPLSLTHSLSPQVLLGAGMLTALVLPRPIALALTAAALLPPILRTALHSWHWSRARKGGSGGGTSGGKGERGEKGELKAEGIKGGIGAEREGLLGEVLFEPDKTMANGKENGVGGRHEAAASANVLSVNGIDIFQGRMAGKMDGDFCLFLIGARANNPFPMGPAFPSVGEVFNQAVR